MTLDLATFDRLLSAEGERALHAATALAPTDANYLAVSDRLRKHFPPDLAAPPSKPSCSARRRQ